MMIAVPLVNSWDTGIFHIGHRMGSIFIIAACFSYKLAFEEILGYLVGNQRPSRAKSNPNLHRPLVSTSLQMAILSISSKRNGQAEVEEVRMKSPAPGCSRKRDFSTTTTRKI